MSALESWALPQLSRLLPLDEESLAQVISYAQSLPKDAASDHLRNLLGDTGPALEFISAFNQRRPQAPAASSSAPVTTQTSAAASASGSQAHDGVPPRVKKGKSNAKKPFNQLPPPRQVQNYDGRQGGYVKRDAELDYMTSSKTPAKKQLASTLALQDEPDAIKASKPSRPALITDDTIGPAASQSTSRSATPAGPSKLPPSAAGPLISDSSKSSRNSSPAPAKTKVNITGGQSMRGGNSALADLDSAIRQLEQQTNPSLSATSNTNADLKARRCPCQAQRHALLAAAPNCLNCGKIICAKEGLGPCTFCGLPLLSRDDLSAMLRALKDERGRERMQSHNAQHKRADVAVTPRPFSGTQTPVSGSASDAEPDTTSGEAVALARARAHRDKLLTFQAQNARRTAVHDEAADFETPDAGLSMWASPQERALQLKRQQRVLREQEWAARPEWEKKRMVVSLDVRGGKAVRRFEQVSKEEALAGMSDNDEEIATAPAHNQSSDGVHSGSAFAKNPLLGGLVRPVWTPDKGKTAATGDELDQATRRASRWRRVQDDDDDNEKWILDGGAYGNSTENRILGAEEAACG